MSERSVALIQDSKVVNIAVFPPDWQSTLTPNMFGVEALVDYTEMNPAPEIGTEYVNGQFVFPEPEPEP